MVHAGTASAEMERTLRIADNLFVWDVGRRGGVSASEFRARTALAEALLCGPAGATGLLRRVALGRDDYEYRETVATGVLSPDGVVEWSAP